MKQQQKGFWSRTELILGPPKHNRKRSEKRQRTKLIAIRLLPAEYTALVNAAHDAGVSISELIRSSALDRITTTQREDT